MPNRLAKETSPYLLQHADNPVDWYPWGEEAFAEARATGKPLLLSIGYSACHWCHVMAHESFEDEATAELMNDLFVNIKVDREERPDIDKIYQTAHQLITQRGGGWPLTMFLDGDDQRPFFGGTYFPKEPRYGMPAFGDLLKKIAIYYTEKRDDVRQQSDRLLDVFNRLEPEPAAAGQVLSDAPLALARNTFEQTLDREYGGFGSAPKFPHPTTLDRLLRHWRSTANDTEPDVEALFMVALTLARMAEGGLFDHIGGGFYRYSVDRLIAFGKSRISKRCFTTMVRCWPSMPRPPSPQATRCSIVLQMPLPTGCLQTCATLTAVFTRRATPIRRGTKVCSTCGIRTKYVICWATILTCLPSASVSILKPISRAGGT
jgi:uncharacterized protein YyaL (SSP411 family)